MYIITLALLLPLSFIFEFILKKTKNMPCCSDNGIKVTPK